MKLYSPKTISEIKNKYGFSLSKSLGQNFLVDKNIIDKIVDSADLDENQLAIEIGPGIGVITYELAQKAGKVVAIEIDKNLIPILSDTLGEYSNVKVLNRDVLKTDINKIIDESGYKQVKIIGNLPYYITTPIIMHILENKVKAESITIMMQKEVADRLMAKPGSKSYGAITAAVNFYSTIDKVASVPKEVFVPAPKVDSTVLRLNIRKEVPVDLKSEKLFFRCITQGFMQRRKTILNSLSGVAPLSKDELREVLKISDIDEKRRAETLSIEDFARLSNNFYQILGGENE